MIRVRTLLTLAIPSLFIGGLLFGNHAGHAAGNGDLFASPPTPPGGWGPLPPPTPPSPPTAPSHGRHGGVSVSIHGNKVKITGIADFVAGHLETIRQLLRDNPNIPRDVRDKILARMDRVRGVIDRRLNNLHTGDLDQIGADMDKMGEELERAMEGLDKDLANLDKDFAKNFGKDFEKAFGKHGRKKPPRDVWAGSDQDDDDDKAEADDDEDEDKDDDKDAVPMVPDVGVDADDDDLRDALGDLKDLALKPSQKEAIVALRTTSDARVATAKQQLDDASRRLETALGDPRTSDADIARYVDQISGHEAAIRKARLLAWVNARRVLDDDQIQRIERAAKTAGQNKPR